jgi:hypothetical protein
MKIIANQKDPLNKLLELMEPASTDSGVTEVKEMLKPLHEAFKKVEGEELTTEQFNEISDAVAKVRAEII